MSRTLQITYISLGLLITVTLTILAIYAAVKANHLYLPIPTFPNVLAVVLPMFSFLVFLYNSSSSKKGFIVQFLPRSAGLVILTIFDAVLATVASTNLQPELLECAIDNRWIKLWTSKNVRAIKSIQEAFNCCGLHSTVDRAWPFQDAHRSARACIELYKDRSQSCEQPWKQQERKVLGIWLAIGLTGMLVKAIFVLAQRQEPNAMIRQHIRQANSLAQRALTQGDRESESYRDDPTEDRQPERPAIEDPEDVRG